MHYGKGGLVLCAVVLAAQGSAQEMPTANKATTQKSSPLPARKNGLWEVTLRSDDLVLRRSRQAQPRPQTVQICTSAETEPVMLFAIVPAQEDCHQVKITRQSKKMGGGYEINTVCYVHGNRADAHMQLMGNLQSAYNGAFSVIYPQTPLQSTGRVAFEGRWLGPCKSGQRPGDMVLPNGVTVNVVDDKKRIEGQNHERQDHKH